MRRKLTQKEVLDRFKKVHGNEYDYSLVEYEGQSKKVIIVCSVHGEFLQTPGKHGSGRGCPKCGTIRSNKNSKLTQKEVLERFKKVHGDEYDYSQVDYFGTKTKIQIICKKNSHGVFTQIPSNHFKGVGCPKCGQIMAAAKQTKSTEDFIKKAKEVHPDAKYDYSKVEYKGSHKNIIIVCPLHGDFEQQPTNHLQGSRCMKCSIDVRVGTRTLNIDEFIERSKIIHNNLYGYEKVVYVNNSTEVVISCPIHGDFQQTPQSHLVGSGCNDCGILRSREAKLKTQEQFIKEANIKHGRIYKYDNVDYKTTNKKVSITCTIHGYFQQTPSAHLVGQGCPKCKNKNEGRLAIILNEIGVVHRNYRINNRFFDFYLPNYNLIIERDGEQHYIKSFTIISKRAKTIEENHQNDIEKTKLAKSKGHKICRIPYWLSEEDERKEIQNILNGQPTYPDVPDLEQAKTKPLPN